MIARKCREQPRRCERCIIAQHQNSFILLLSILYNNRFLIKEEEEEYRGLCISPMFDTNSQRVFVRACNRAPTPKHNAPQRESPTLARLRAILSGTCGACSNSGFYNARRFLGASPHGAKPTQSHSAGTYLLAHNHHMYIYAQSIYTYWLRGIHAHTTMINPCVCALMRGLLAACAARACPYPPQCSKSERREAKTR